VGQCVLERERILVTDVPPGLPLDPQTKLFVRLP
jgi:hypothetical protein